MAKIEIEKIPIDEKRYKVIKPCPYGKTEQKYIQQFSKMIVGPVFVGSESCKNCEYFGDYTIDKGRTVIIDCKCGSLWQRLKRSLKSCLRWLER